MKYLKWIFVLFVSILLISILISCIGGKSIDPEVWAMRNTVSRLKESMKDPESMAIRSSYALKKIDESGSTEIFICGIVDGRNGFGGYTGGVLFASRSVSTSSGAFDTYSVEMEDIKQKNQSSRLKRLSFFEEFYWNKYCVNDMHPPLIPAN